MSGKSWAEGQGNAGSHVSELGIEASDSLVWHISTLAVPMSCVTTQTSPAVT